MESFCYLRNVLWFQGRAEAAVSVRKLSWRKQMIDGVNDVILVSPLQLLFSMFHINKLFTLF